MIISCVRSRAEFVASDRAKGMGFIHEPKRYGSETNDSCKNGTEKRLHLDSTSRSLEPKNSWLSSETVEFTR